MRLLNPSDLDDALELSRAAGWNQTRSDWERLLALTPQGCFGIERDGRVVATATAIRYDLDLAWIGMVLTDPKWRGGGLASALLSTVLDYTADVRCRMLDATAAGLPIYERLGFRPLCPVERWEGRPSRRQTVPAVPGHHDAVLDRQCFGADRGALLRTFNPPLIAPGAYVYSRPGAIARYLGPCIASDIRAAEGVIHSCLEAYPGEAWFWDLLPDNAGAAALATSFGFAPVRRLVRMYTGTLPLQQVHWTYAIAGFEVG